ncbi:MAG: hypothetical protein ACOC22_03650 [bacterium]
MKVSDYNILIFDKKDNFSTFYDEENKEPRLEGWVQQKKTIINGEDELSYCNNKVDDVEIFYIFHNYNNINKSILDENHIIKPIIEKIQSALFLNNKTLFIAGHWSGGKELSDYQEDTIKPANNKKENIERKFYLSYYGSEITRNCVWVRADGSDEKLIVNKIIELADINKLNKLEEPLEFHKTQISTLESSNKTMPTDSENKDNSDSKNDVQKMTGENEKVYINNYKKKVKELNNMYRVIAEYYNSKR